MFDIGFAELLLIGLVALIVVNRPLPDQPGGEPLDAGEARAELLEQAPGTVVVPWSPPEIEQYQGVQGDVVEPPGHSRDRRRPHLDDDPAGATKGCGAVMEWSGHGHRPSSRVSVPRGPSISAPVPTIGSQSTQSAPGSLSSRSHQCRAPGSWW